MTHTRLCKFNTKDTYPEQSLDDFKNIESHEPVAQTHKAMQNIKQLIEDAVGEMARPEWLVETDGTAVIPA